jgi:hypothetical protein
MKIQPRYTFDNNGYPINKRGQSVKTFLGVRLIGRTATFKQSVNNEGSRVRWIHVQPKEAV